MKNNNDDAAQQLTALIDEYAKAINQNIVERFTCVDTPVGKEFLVQLSPVADLDAIRQNLMIWIRFHLSGATINTSTERKNVFTVAVSTDLYSIGSERYE